MSKIKTPKFASNQTELARLLSAAFNTKIVRQQIHRWRLTMDAPSPDSSGRHRIAPWITWYQVNISAVSREAAEATSLTAIRREREMLELQNARHAAEVRDGIWIKKSESYLREAGDAKRYHLIVRNAVEFEPEREVRERLREQGLNDSTIAVCCNVMKAAGVKAIDQIETECGKIAEAARLAVEAEKKAA
jgi:hypothetical protein